MQRSQQLHHLLLHPGLDLLICPGHGLVVVSVQRHCTDTTTTTTATTHACVDNLPHFPSISHFSYSTQRFQTLSVHDISRVMAICLIWSTCLPAATPVTNAFLLSVTKVFLLSVVFVSQVLSRVQRALGSLYPHQTPA